MLRRFRKRGRYVEHVEPLVVLERDPTTPLITALVTECRLLAKMMMDR